MSITKYGFGRAAPRCFGGRLKPHVLRWVETQGCNPYLVPLTDTGAYAGCSFIPACALRGTSALSHKTYYAWPIIR